MIDFQAKKMFQKLSTEEIREIHLQIGRNVRQCRRKKGFSQLDLAIELGYKSTSPISMAEIYYKKTHFNIEGLSNIARCLDVEMAALLMGVDEIIHQRAKPHKKNARKNNTITPNNA